MTRATSRPLPANVRAERLSPAGAGARPLPLAITHGGAGSTIAALAFGLPVLVCRVARRARRVWRLGAPSWVQPSCSTPTRQRRKPSVKQSNGCSRIPATRAGAQRVRESITAEPPASSLVRHLEAVANAA